MPKHKLTNEDRLKGSKTISEAKAKASRENGKKGGRPKNNGAKNETV